MNIVIDTNVIISGILWTGIPNKIISAVEQGKFTSCCTPSIISEIENVLKRPYFTKRIDALNISVDSIVTGILEFSKLYEDSVASPVVLSDPDDDKFIFCALASQAKYIISGDRHLLDLRQWQGVKIVSPQNFYSIALDI